MKALINLLIADIKMTMRNKQALFWRLVFPVIFIVIFGLFNLDSMGASKMVIIDNADTTISHTIVDGLKEIDMLKVETTTNTDQLNSDKDRLKRDEIDFILQIPSGVKDIPENATAEITIDPITMQPIVEAPQMPQDINLKIYYNEANLASNQLVFNILDQMTTKMNAKAADAPEIFKLDKESLANRNIRYIDFLMPGILAMSLMQSAIIGIAVYITEAREKKILKRVLATPVDRKTFIAAQVVSNLVVSFIQAIIIIATARICYDVNIYGSYWAIALWAVLGTLVFLNLGFIIAGVSRTTSAAEGLSQVISMPMMFLSGVFFSTDTLPKVVQHIVDYLPLTPFIDALRKIILNGDPLSATSHQLLIVGAWIVASFIATVFIFKNARD